MIKNYLKIALRNLWKQKSFSAINIMGLAVGLCCFLLISLYVIDELSFDKYHKKANRIYRVNSDITFGGTKIHIAEAPDVMGAALKKDYPQIEEFTRIYTNDGNKLVRKGSEFINEFNVANVDSTFFDVFTIPVIDGDTRTALNEPNTVVLTSSTAKKYFGTTNVVGKTIETNDNGSSVYKITAVVQDMPKNSHFNFDFFFSMKNVDYPWGRFTSHNFYTYLLFKPGMDAKGFDKNFDQYIAKYVLPEAAQFMQIKSMDEFKKSGNSLVYELMPLTKIHLHSDRSHELSPGGNMKYVYIFSAVAIFILLIACINFMNLTTARSANRAKEVGIRKVLGTERRMLIMQFLSESTLTVFFSLVLAIVLTYFSLPLFNSVSDKTMSLDKLTTPGFLTFLLLLPFIVGLFAGSYPAFYLSSFRPIAVLKGKISSGAKKSGLRSSLVVFQFASSIILIIGTIVIFRQLNYIQNKDIGFNKEQVLIVNDAYSLKDNADVFKEEVKKLPGITNGTLSSFLPVSNSSRNDNSFSKEAVMDSKSGFNLQTWAIDYDYLETMGMKMIRGRNFSKEFGGDSSAVIINESTAKLLGYEDPVGKKIYNGSTDPTQRTAFTIIGVVRNFNYESLKSSIQPLSFFLKKSRGLASFKVNTKNMAGLLKSVEAKWKTMVPGIPYSYRFLDESFNEMYKNEQRVGKIALIFSILAILIACLGLFGLAAFIAEQRTKEIGIRKVLGASVQGLVSLLSKDFIKLVLISFVIAAPLAWYFMNKWLQEFEYRISISWTIFLLAGLIALLIAIATISFQAIRAAIANPVKNLRSE